MIALCISGSLPLTPCGSYCGNDQSHNNLLDALLVNPSCSPLFASGALCTHIDPSRSSFLASYINVSGAIKRGEQYVEENERLKEIIDKIINDI